MTSGLSEGVNDQGNSGRMSEEMCKGTSKQTITASNPSAAASLGDMMMVSTHLLILLMESVQLTELSVRRCSGSCCRSMCTLQLSL